MSVHIFTVHDIIRFSFVKGGSKTVELVLNVKRNSFIDAF